MNINIYQREENKMGCDCGCGGTCPLCSRILGRLMDEHASVILGPDYHKIIEESKKTKKSKKGRKKK